MLVVCTLSTLNLRMVHCDKELIKGVMRRVSDGNAGEGTREEMPIHSRPRHYLIKAVLCSDVRIPEEYQYPHPWVCGDGEHFQERGVVHMKIFQFLLQTTYRPSLMCAVYNTVRLRWVSDSSVRPRSMWTMFFPHIRTYKYT